MHTGMACLIDLQAKPLPSMKRWPLLLFFFGTALFFAVRVSENQADNDLWGHVLYGRRAIAQGVFMERFDPFSWTMPGAPWINHEILAEWIMGWTYEHLGSSGLLCLPVLSAAGSLALAWNLRRGREASSGPAWAFFTCLFLGVNGIALGLSVRPQLFSMFALCGLFWMMVRVPSRWWKPLLLSAWLALWVNTHGGALAGWVLLSAASIAELALISWKKIFPRYQFFLQSDWSQGRCFALGALLGLPALCANPYGLELPLWLLASVRYVRPEITEWNPPPLTLADPNTLLITVPFLLTIALAGMTFWQLRRHAPFPGWQAAILLGLAVMAARHIRHIPLFHLGILAFLPAALPKLSQAPGRLFGFWGSFFQRVPGKFALSVVGILSTIYALMQFMQRPYPLTIVVEKHLFPVAAIAWMKQHDLQGNCLIQFDWGQQFLWEMQDSRVSFDGRLDTVYSREIIQAHWRFYDGEAGAYNELQGDRADTALLPSDSLALALLLQRGWHLVYIDSVAAVLVRQAEKFPLLARVSFPILRKDDEFVTGVVPFP